MGLRLNNTNFETGRRLQGPDPRELKRSAQRIAREHGLSFYADEPRDPATGVVPDSDPHARRNAHIVERDLVSKDEYSWVIDIHDLAELHSLAARFAKERLPMLRVLGIV